MARIKYYYDTETCRYERIELSRKDVILRILGYLGVSFVLALAMIVTYTRFFPSPEVSILRQQKSELEFYYDLMQEDIKELNTMILALQERDEKIYRMITEAESMPISLRNPQHVSSKRYFDLLAENLDAKELIVEKMAQIEKLKRKMYIQTKSYDEITKLAKSKDKLLSSIPAIQPIKNKKLNMLVSGFGMRMHPIYKVKKMHTGVDFAAKKGTPVFATGDGVILMASGGFSGYGNEIEIKHGYGYITKYAHLSKFAVKRGQKVKRGQLIGYTGNSGTSAAPHLHYEVIYNNKKVNPIHYFFYDITPEEYEKILEIASIENQSLS